MCEKNNIGHGEYPENESGFNVWHACIYVSVNMHRKYSIGYIEIGGKLTVLDGVAHVGDFIECIFRASVSVFDINIYPSKALFTSSTFFILFFVLFRTLK